MAKTVAVALAGYCFLLKRKRKISCERKRKRGLMCTSGGKRVKPSVSVPISCFVVGRCMVLRKRGKEGK